MSDTDTKTEIINVVTALATAIYALVKLIQNIKH